LIRFEQPVLRQINSVVAQGRKYDLGPSFYFKQDDWTITCDLVDGRVVRIGYGKRGEWTEEQFALVLAYNSQGQKWTPTGNPKMAKYSRSWKRSDGATAEWNSSFGMRMVVPAYHRAKQVAEARARAEASRKPKI
jgi:hypothetical protein